ncbi:HD domain-containing protein [Arthrobacter sp. 08Y14]|uniref:HD domain-containing protein n=1 Tax=Arthrobacter sp. 08Y14 TaxID=2058885 RepID=UPI000CE2E780|nr:HD domain-containing protein [Arthrobacter sp. 08Y14]
MRDLVTEAKDVATLAHKGQVDKAGSPYIGHPGRVAGHVTRHAAVEDVEAAQAVAWLHDVVEDTPVTLDDLARQFPADVVAAVDAMTKRAEEDRDAYYRRVRANRIARAVKQADLDDNTDPARTARLDSDTRQRLAAKYDHARSVLSGN